MAVGAGLCFLLASTPCLLSWAPGLSLGSPRLLASPFFPLKFNVISINANRLRMADKRAGFLQWLHSLHVVVDVVCIQESVFLWLNVICGFVLLVFQVLFLLAPRNLAVVLSSFVPLCLWSNLGQMRKGVCCNASFPFVTSPFVLFRCMLPTATL